MSKKSVLLVDDDKSWRIIMANILKDRGFIVFEAVDGRKGIELAKLEKPDIIILDNKMPNMTGQEAAKILKHDPATSSIPIILVTGMDINSSLIDYIKMDVNDFLKKPFATETLITKIKEMTGMDAEDDKISIKPSKIPNIVISLKKTESKYLFTKMLGNDTKITETNNINELLDIIKNIKPVLIVANYNSIGLGTSSGEKILLQALVLNIPILIDIIDALEPVNARKMDSTGKRYYLLQPVNTDNLADSIKSIIGFINLI